MPLPKPSKNQSQNEFVSSCMSSEMMKKEYPDQKQRVAICYSQYKQKKKRKQSMGNNEEPQWSECENNDFIILS